MAVGGNSRTLCDFLLLDDFRERVHRCVRCGTVSGMTARPEGWNLHASCAQNDVSSVQTETSRAGTEGSCAGPDGSGAQSGHSCPAEDCVWTDWVAWQPVDGHDQSLPQRDQLPGTNWILAMEVAAVSVITVPDEAAETPCRKRPPGRRGTSGRKGKPVAGYCRSTRSVIRAGGFRSRRLHGGSWLGLLARGRHRLLNSR